MQTREIAVLMLMGSAVAPVAAHLLRDSITRFRGGYAPCAASTSLPSSADPDEALDYAERAVAAAPLDTGGYLCRGAALLRLGRYDDAGRDFSRARALDRTAAPAAFGLACAATGRGRHAAALAYLAEAVRLDPRTAGTARAEPALRPLHADPAFWKTVTGAEATPRAA